MEMLIETKGQVHCVYGEAIDLHQLGRLKIQRGSHVEPNEEGRWLADLAPVGGPVLGPFDSRSTALKAEGSWLQRWLCRSAESKR